MKETCCCCIYFHFVPLSDILNFFQFYVLSRFLRFYANIIETSLKLGIGFLFDSVSLQGSKGLFSAALFYSSSILHPNL